MTAETEDPLPVLGPMEPSLEYIRQLERTAMAAEERFHALARSTVDAIVTADEKGNVVSWNTGAARMFGYEEAGVLGRPLTVLMPPRHRDAHRAALERFLATGAATLIGRTVELEGLRADGSEFPLELTLSTWSTDGARLFTGIIRDVSDRRRAEEERRQLERQLAERALRDHVTGLPNRALLVDRLELALARAGRERAWVAVLLVDLDRFKAVNEGLGQHVGDELLRAVAGRMKAQVRPGDTVARIGGDEFAVVFEELGTRDEAVELCRTLMSAFDRQFDLTTAPLAVTASGGFTVARGVASGLEPPEPGPLLSEADAALYVARQRGGREPEMYDDRMREDAVRRQSTAQDLRLAVGGDQFVVHYQPIIALGSGAVFGAEALVRWRHPARGLLGPEEFVPVAEETGLIVPLGRWVLAQACRQAVEWQGEASRRRVSLSVNVSTRQFRQADWTGHVARALSEADLAPEQLVLEITESALVEDMELAAVRLTELHQMGVRLAIDDFGTGYSSLGYLRHLPIDILKIDKSFIDGITEGPHESALARAVLKLAKTLGLQSVAEGVERHEQLVMLQRLGCQLGQGFYLGRPQPPGEMTELLRGRTPTDAPQPPTGRWPRSSPSRRQPGG